MGNVYQLTCEKCDYQREVFDGAGMEGTNTNWYCPTCGRFEEQFISIERMQVERTDPPPPACAAHPAVTMIELEFPEDADRNGIEHRTDVPCRRCGENLVSDAGLGIWD